MRKLPLLFTALLLAGCTVGPNYHRPAIDSPSAYRSESPTQVSASSAESIGNEKWWDVFQDPILQQLTRTALQQNYDVQIAATRVLQAQAELGITRANQFPMLGGGAQALSERNPKISSAFPAYQTNVGQVDLSVIWNLDFWGKYRRQTEAARAELLASEWGRRAVLTSVVSSVASAYFQLRELDLALDISKSTLASRQDSLRLTNVLAKNGSASMLDVRQSEELLYTASEAIPDLERQIAQQENALSILLGENPTDIPRGWSLIQQPNPPVVPAGLPSELLERRPDIREAEENLIAANAEIGVARAAYFPSISLTGTAGFESYSLIKLFNASSGLWNTAATATQPIFEAGGLHAGMQLAEAQQQQMLLTYRQTIIGAFQQVSDSLVGYQKDRQYREQQALLTSSAEDADHLSNTLYQHGGASYLQVLTSETNYFDAELNLAQADLNERLSLVQLYNALGGGWQQ
ncbi:MAG TPA: efflux transporter outer membrane subunit [Candidatus Acidoferrales bacterium]|nr:efflux transporter outer membrane subunit [Candidatus Acidoferrales bacterium]